MKRFYKWTVEVEMDPMWVADGFDLTDERAVDMVRAYMPHVYGHEVRARVLSRPPDEAVATEMGFKSVEEYLKDRDE